MELCHVGSFETMEDSLHLVEEIGGKRDILFARHRDKGEQTNSDLLTQQNYQDTLHLVEESCSITVTL